MKTAVILRTSVITILWLFAIAHCLTENFHIHSKFLDAILAKDCHASSHDSLSHKHFEDSDHKHSDHNHSDSNHSKSHGHSEDSTDCGMKMLSRSDVTLKFQTASELIFLFPAVVFNNLQIELNTKPGIVLTTNIPASLRQLLIASVSNPNAPPT